MLKLSASTYNIRHYNEIKRYFDKGANILHIVNDEAIGSFDLEIQTKYIKIDDDIKQILSDEVYDLIVVTDIFELTSDIFKFLDTVNRSLKQNGKLLITSVNTKWNLLLYLFELLNLKKGSRPRSYIHPKK